MIRCFARHLSALDPATEVPPLDLLPRVSARTRATLYLYSASDVAALMEAARTTRFESDRAAHLPEPSSGSSPSPASASGKPCGSMTTTWTGSVACWSFGRRKFERSREVPLHPSTLAGSSRQYVTARDQRHRPATLAEPVHVLRAAGGLSYGGIRWHFDRLVRKAGLKPKSPRCRPCLHDFRHSFACATLEDWYRAGVDVRPAMPVLSTYLGHVDPSRLLVSVGRPRAAGRSPPSGSKRAWGRCHDRARAPLQAFFTDRLITPAQAQPEHRSPPTATPSGCCSRFAAERTGKQPFELDIDDLDAPLIGAFLEHLERDRHNSLRTRNARLAADPLASSASLRCEHPEHAAIDPRVLAIPTKRHERNTVTYLTATRSTPCSPPPTAAPGLGRRDHALLVLMIQTGVRVSELTGLHRRRRRTSAAGAHVRLPWARAERSAQHR